MEKTISHYLLDAKKRSKTQVASLTKIDGVWEPFLWAEYYEAAEKVGQALMGIGVEKYGRVAIMANTRLEWSLADIGALGIGASTVPIYQSYLPEDVSYILQNSGSTVLFCENEAQVKKWQRIKEDCPLVERVIVFDNYEARPDDVTLWSDFLHQGAERLIKNPTEFESRCRKNLLTDDATLIYTSGTTGKPKGVVLTHTQIMSELIDTFGLLKCGLSDTTLSFLPYAHVLGRIESWGNVYAGFTLAYAESIEKIAANLGEVKPTVIIAVPRIFEKIYNGVIAKASATPAKAKVFNWAIKIGKAVSSLKAEKQAIPLPLMAKYMIARKLVFDKFLEKMGGRIRFAVCGGAPLSQEIAEFFHGANFLILEGYGLTETTAAVTLNTPYAYKFGTVGKPLGDTSIKIAEDGEILIKSDKVMKEYYKNENATAEVMLDGYFATGDIGVFTDDGYLRITDRKKDLIKTAGGKYVAPQRLENLLKLNAYVSNALIHGDQRKYIVALITLDADAVKRYAAKKDLSYSNFEELAKSVAITNLVREAVAETNGHLASFESIKNFEILASDFTVESGELTPSLKVKRKVCDERYKPVIDKLYGVDQGTL